MLALVCALGVAGHATADGTQTLTVELAAASVTEGPGAKLVFVVKLSDGPDAATFDYAPAGSATPGADFTLAPKTGETVPAGGSLTIEVPIVDDALDEADETVHLAISNVVGATTGSTATPGTIVDDDGPPAVASIADVEVEEDDLVAPVTVTLSGPSGKRITIDYRVGEGSTATQGADFTLAAGELVFEPGVTSQSVAVNILEDTRFESTETVFVIFFGHENVQPGSDLEGKVTIRDDGDSPDAPTVPNAEVVEGNPAEGQPATTDLVFQVSLPGPRPQTTFNYRTVPGSAATPGDFEGGGAVVLPASSAPSPPPVPVTIKVKRDTVDEVNETFTLELVNASTGALVATSTGTILNDDDNSKLSIADASASEPTSGTASLELTISLSPASERQVTVKWATTPDGGTATAGVDYTPASGTVTFKPGEPTTQKVAVPLLADGVNEDNETVRVVLTEPTGVPGANVVDAEALGTIVEGNAPPSLSVSDTVAQEGKGAEFVVTLAGTTARTVTVGFSTSDGTAKAGADYVPRTGMLTFAPGEKTKTLAVTVLDDPATEPSEDFTMRIGDPVNATITKASGRALIEASDGNATPAPAPFVPTQPKTPAAIKAPRMVLGPSSVRVGKAGVARMSVACESASPIACAGTVELERSAKPLLKLGKKAFWVRRGGKGFASVKLSAKSLALLRKQGTMRVRVVVVYKKSQGTGRAVPGVVTLISTVPKPKPKPTAKPAGKDDAAPKPAASPQAAAPPPEEPTRVEIVP